MSAAEMREIAALASAAGVFNLKAMGPSSGRRLRGFFHIANLERDAAERVRGALGGEVTPQPDREGIFIWRARGVAAWDATRAVLPYMTDRRSKASALVAYYEGRL